MNEGLAQQKKEELESLKAEHHQVSLLVNTRQMSVSQLEDKREEIRTPTRILHWRTASWRARSARSRQAERSLPWSAIFWKRTAIRNRR